MTYTSAPATTVDTLHDASALTGSAATALARVLFGTTIALAVVTSAVAGLYLVKSALGINLLPGHSPLHDLLYHWVR